MPFKILCLLRTWNCMCTISMTSLFAHKVAQPTKWRFLPKNLSQPKIMSYFQYFSLEVWLILCKIYGPPSNIPAFYLIMIHIHNLIHISNLIHIHNLIYVYLIRSKQFIRNIKKIQKILSTRKSQSRWNNFIVLVYWRTHLMQKVMI